MKVRQILIVTAVALAVSCGKIPNNDCMGRVDLPSNVFITTEKARTIADIVCKYVHNDNVPSIQVTIIDSLGNTWSLSTGSADRKGKQPLTNDNLFRLASLTKTVTASVILSMIEEGKLTLDDKLITYFPEFTLAKDVTIRNLLNHSSGILELLLLPDVVPTSTLFTDKIWDLNSLMKTISTKEPAFQPGTDFHYSNTDYVLLGLIAEKITHKEMPELYKEYIFNPLKLDKLILVPQESTPDALISGYDRDEFPTPGLYEVTPQNTSWSSAAFTAGALIGNSGQIGLFYHNLLTGKLLSKNSLYNMEDFIEEINPESSNMRYFGLGLFKYEINHKIYFGHEGLFIGFYNLACFRKSDKVTIVMLSNMSTFNKFNMLQEIDLVL
jgi:D-alanyl-D-alanine carboxypeptidase